MGFSRNPVMVFVSNLPRPSALDDLYPPDWHDRVRAARLDPGYLASPPFDIMGRATGHLVLLLRSGQEVMADIASARRKVLEITEYAAEQLDGDVIGLGSLTTPITGGGHKVVEHIERHDWKLRATHGDSGSVAAILECVELAALREDDTIAVVGAYGIIGTPLSRILARQGRRLMLVGPRLKRLQELARDIDADCGRPPELVATDIAAVASADCVITVTSHPSSLLTPAHVKPGAVVIDPAVPANVSPDPAWRDPARGNVVITNAAQLRMPGVAASGSMWGTLDEPDGRSTTYACLAETMLCAVHQDTQHHVGEVDLGFIDIARERARGAGFEHAIPRMFDADLREPLAVRARQRSTPGRFAPRIQARVTTTRRGRPSIVASVPPSAS